MSRRSRTSHRARGEAGVPMAPMIDMVFLLLVFFMTASAMSQHGNRVEVALPDAPSSVVPKDLSRRIVVTLDRSGKLYWGPESIELDDLSARLRRERERSPAIKLRIRADRATQFGKIKAVMRTAAGDGVQSYLYATYQGGDE